MSSLNPINSPITLNPKIMLYTDDHFWLQSSRPNIWYLGLTEFFFSEHGKPIDLQLPPINSLIQKGESFATIEATKTVSDLIAPISGKVLERQENLSLPDLNSEIWLICVEANLNPSEFMNLDDYSRYCSPETVTPISL